jgi:hypothetical protein
METQKKEVTGQDKNKASAKFLEKLSEQLHSSNASIRRQAAFNLSWMQEDGLEILKTVLFSDVATRTKNAAAYGVRKMRGRMKKPALDVLRQGLSRDGATKEVCTNALKLMGQSIEKQAGPVEAAAPLGIEEIPSKRRSRKKTAPQEAEA